MGIHLDFFEKIIESCPEPLRINNGITMDAILTRYTTGWPEMEPQPDDDFLTALNKDETRKKTKLGARPDTPKGEWLTIKKAIERHVSAGMNEGFLITSLFFMLDEQLRVSADETNHKRSLETMEATLAVFREAKRDDHPDNAPNWDGSIMVAEDYISNSDANLKKQQEWFRIWRSLPPVHMALSMERTMGQWSELLHEDIRRRTERNEE